MLYTLTVCGERFNFTKEQLESDPENYFEAFFFGSFSEASQGTKELMIEEEPALFRLIQAHLRGYDVLPIPDGYISYMSKEIVLKNLLKEAEFYALANLVKKIKAFQTAPSKYKLRSRVFGSQHVYSQDLNEAEYYCLLSCGGTIQWGQWDDTLRMDGYKVLKSWRDGGNRQDCAVLILDE